MYMLLLYYHDDGLCTRVCVCVCLCSRRCERLTINTARVSYEKNDAFKNALHVVDGTYIAYTGNNHIIVMTRMTYSIIYIKLCALNRPLWL